MGPGSSRSKDHRRRDVHKGVGTVLIVVDNHIVLEVQVLMGHCIFRIRGGVIEHVRKDHEVVIGIRIRRLGLIKQVPGNVSGSAQAEVQTVA